MTDSDSWIRAWRIRLGFRMKDAAAELGVSVSTLGQYEAGKRRDTGSPVAIPRTVALACSAIDAGLPPFDEALAQRSGKRL